MYNAIQQVIDNDLNVRLKIFYFTLEMTAEEKMLSAFSNLLYLKEKVRVSPTDLKSTRSDNVLSDDVIQLIEDNKDYFNKIEETVTFIDNIRNPTGIYKFMQDYAKQNGIQHKKKIDFNGIKREIHDYYEPNDPDEYVMLIIDHIALITPEEEDGRKLSLHQSIGKLSSRYLVNLRNKYNYIPVIIQQQASGQESLENARANRLKPTLDGLGDNKMTQRDCNIALALFSPFRHEIPEYFEYDVTFFKDNIRFLEIIASREGGAGTIAPLYFDGCVNYFKELPLPSMTREMNQVKNHIIKLRENET